LMLHLPHVHSVRSLQRMPAVFSWLPSASPSSSDHADLHSFPTRRSSDLCLEGGGAVCCWLGRWWRSRTSCCSTNPPTISTSKPRSEEHTSELQSHLNLVCRLLLE